MWLAGGASCENFTSLTRTFFSPVAASTYQSSPCSPASSRCTKLTLVPSGLHLIVSGARPVTPDSAKICSIVSCFGAADDATVWACPAERRTSRLMAKMKRSFFTNALRFRTRCDPAPLVVKLKSVQPGGSLRQEGTDWFGGCRQAGGAPVSPPPRVIRPESSSSPRAPDALLHTPRSPLHAAALNQYRPIHSAGNAARTHPSRTPPRILACLPRAAFQDQLSAGSFVSLSHVA